MSPTIFLTTECLILGTILLVFGMRYLSAAQQARARLANDQAYRSIAEKAAETQAQTTTALSSIETILAEVRSSLAAVELVLKAVG